jgi:hypothetical protein
MMIIVPTSEHNAIDIAANLFSSGSKCAPGVFCTTNRLYVLLAANAQQ